jgi:hypothetical protein
MLFWVIAPAAPTSRARNFLKGTDNASMFLWVDNYCRAPRVYAQVDQEARDFSAGDA